MTTTRFADYVTLQRRHVDTLMIYFDIDPRRSKSRSALRSRISANRASPRRRSLRPRQDSCRPHSASAYPLIHVLLHQEMVFLRPR